jgi:hypothetical protein
MIRKSEMENIGDIFKKKTPGKKPPAYQWQDLALRVIEDLHIPSFKRNSVFKACRDHDKYFIQKCVGEKWKYFFKLVGKKPEEK